jgi:tetratricopeptide (TPR) repeat protein
VAAFGVLIVLVVAAAFLGWRRARPADLLLLAALLPLALLARRNIPLFALVALPAASPMVQEALRRAGAWMGGRLPAARALGPAAASAAAAAFVAACALLLLLDVWSNRFHARDGTHRQFGLGEAPGLYPGGAARFVAERRPPGEVFNDMTSGGYLAWRWFPDRRVFIDGRLEVHDEALFAEYLRAQRDPRFFEEMARRRDVRLVVWSHRQSVEAAPLLRHLATDPGWRLVFLDRSSTVFVRHDRAAEASLGLAAIDPGDPGLGRRVLEEIGQAEREALRDDPAPALLRRALPLLAVPMMEVNAGLLFGVLGHTGPAEALFRAAIDRAPRNATLRYDLGLVLETAGRREEARGAFEAALGLDPGFAAARGALGLALLRDGDEPGALEQWRLAERSGGDLGAAVLRARGALHARRGRVDEAIEDYRRAIRSDPRSPALSAEIALLYHRRGLNDRATAEIRRALALDPGAVPPRVALARMREAEGDLTGAERLLRDLVASHPGSPEARLGLAAILAARGRRDESLAECAAAIAAGLDPADLSREPALRILAGTPEYRRLIGGAAAPPPKERR